MSDIEEYLPSWRPARARRPGWLGMAVTAVVVVVIAGAGAGAGGVLAADRPGEARPAAAQSELAPPVPPLPPSPAAAHPPSEAPEPPATTHSPRSTGFPPVFNVRYGESYWAVFLAVTGLLDDPLQGIAEQQALAAGYGLGDPVLSSVSCQQGAREGLVASGAPLDPRRDYATLLLRFGTREAAAAFVDAYEPPVVGTVQVTWSCAG